MSKLQNLFVTIKKTGTATDDEINNVLVIPFALDVEGIENLLQRIQDAGIAITDNEGNPSERVLSTEEEPELSDEDLIGQHQPKSMTLFVCT